MHSNRHQISTNNLADGLFHPSFKANRFTLCSSLPEANFLAPGSKHLNKSITDVCVSVVGFILIEMLNLCTVLNMAQEVLFCFFFRQSEGVQVPELSCGKSLINIAIRQQTLKQDATICSPVFLAHHSLSRKKQNQKKNNNTANRNSTLCTICIPADHTCFLIFIISMEIVI